MQSNDFYTMYGREGRDEKEGMGRGGVERRSGGGDSGRFGRDWRVSRPIWCCVPDIMYARGAESDEASLRMSYARGWNGGVEGAIQVDLKEIGAYRDRS